MMKEGIEQPARLVNIRHLNDPSYPLRDIAEVKAESIPEGVWQLLPGGDNGNPPQRRDCIRLGALVTVAQLAAHPLLKSKTPALSEAAVEIATPQIRQVATLSGNLLQRPALLVFPLGGISVRQKGWPRSALPAKAKTTSMPSSTTSRVQRYTHRVQQCRSWRSTQWCSL